RPRRSATLVPYPTLFRSDAELPAPLHEPEPDDGRALQHRRARELDRLDADREHAVAVLLEPRAHFPGGLAELAHEIKRDQREEDDERAGEDLLRDLAAPSLGIERLAHGRGHRPRVRVERAVAGELRVFRPELHDGARP